MTTLQIETAMFLADRDWRRKLVSQRLALVGVRAPQPRSNRKRAKRAPAAQVLDRPGRILRRTFHNATVTHR